MRVIYVKCNTKESGFVIYLMKYINDNIEYKTLNVLFSKSRNYVYRENTY